MRLVYISLEQILSHLKAKYLDAGSEDFMGCGSAAS
jgi:hypothetical protein